MTKRILCDCDGVLTDGTVNIDHTGEKLFKSFHTRDVRAIRELIFNGWDFYIVTQDDSAIAEHFAKKVGAEWVPVRDKSKVPFPDGSFLAIGDDASDRGMLKRARLGFVPLDTDRSLLDLRHVHRLAVEGGKGVVAAVVWYLETQKLL